jgi:hypothetical protein
MRARSGKLNFKVELYSVLKFITISSGLAIYTLDELVLTAEDDYCGACCGCGNFCGTKQ